MKRAALEEKRDIPRWRRTSLQSKTKKNNNSQTELDIFATVLLGEDKAINPTDRGWGSKPHALESQIELKTIHVENLGSCHKR